MQLYEWPKHHVNPLQVLLPGEVGQPTVACGPLPQWMAELEPLYD